MESKHYSLADFRKSTREAFNIVDAGGAVTIERYGVYYELKLSYGEAYDIPVSDKATKKVHKLLNEAPKRETDRQRMEREDKERIAKRMGL